jgi:UDP-2,3-diacylglucosamine hydrolase
MTAAIPAAGKSPLALICGGGSLPLTVADLAAKRDQKILLFPLHGAANPRDFVNRPHQWLYLGQVGRFMRLARAAGCNDVVLIGSVVRPAFWQLRLDLRTVIALPRLALAFRGGDNHLLSIIGRLMEGYGFRMIGAHEVAPEILVPHGSLGRLQPTERDRADITMGLDYLRAAGPFDIGQAVVVTNKRVLAVEAAEGTDAMLARVAEMRASGRVRTPAGTGVLVKAPKPGQDLRFDMPSIGPKTVEGAALAGLAGIAVLAGSTIVAEPAGLVEAADRAKIFVSGESAGTAR